MAVFQNNLLAGAGAQSSDSTHTINQSIRFNDDDSPALNKTYSGAGSQTTFTYSCWLKVATTDTGSGFPLFNGGTGTSDTTWSGVAYYQGMIYSQGYNTNWRITSRKLRDPSAWYHIVYVWDTTNPSPDERIRIYINGTRETEFSTFNNPGASANSGINTATQHTIGYQSRTVGWGYADAYLAEMVFIDGQALEPSSFAETNENGIWVPKDVSGLTFGTNGFHIDGRDSSDLGDDESGRGNDYTATGLAAHDQVSDSPTNNFCTINAVYTDNSSQVSFDAGTLSNGNLVYVGSNNTFSVKGFTFNLPKSGKWYFEYMIGGTSDGFGFVKQGEQGSINASNGPGQLSVAQGGGIQYSGWRNGGNFTVNFGTTFTAGHIHQVAIDVDNGKFFYGVQNTYYAADAGTDGNPSAGTNETSTFAFSTTDVVLLAGNYTGTQYWNFGQDGTFAGQQTAQGNSDANGVGNFYYAVPTGYLALCTKNLGS